MAKECKDAQGNIVDCDTLKGQSWKQSDNLSLGTQMQDVYTPPEVGQKDESVYDKLQNEIDRGFALEKYGYEGSDLDEYIKAKHTKKIYTNPSKNPQQNQDLEKINKKSTPISVVTSITPELIQPTSTIDNDPSGSDGRQKQSTMKQKPNRSKRSLNFNNITVSGNPPPMASTESSVSCPKHVPAWLCAEGRAERKAKRKEQRTPIRKWKNNSSTQRKSSKWNSGAGIKRNVRSLFS